MVRVLCENTWDETFKLTRRGRPYTKFEITALSWAKLPTLGEPVLGLLLRDQLIFDLETRVGELIFLGKLEDGRTVQLHPPLEITVEDNPFDLYGYLYSVAEQDINRSYTVTQFTNLIFILYKL